VLEARSELGSVGHHFSSENGSMSHISWWLISVSTCGRGSDGRCTMFVAHLENSNKTGLAVTSSISTVSNRSNLTRDIPAQEDSGLVLTIKAAEAESTELGWARSIGACIRRAGALPSQDETTFMLTSWHELKEREPQLHRRWLHQRWCFFVVSLPTGLRELKGERTYRGTAEPQG
jgi:hypothetical protein